MRSDSASLPWQEATPPRGEPASGGQSASRDHSSSKFTSGGEPASRHLRAESEVASLYESHALPLTMLAHVMLGDKASAEDVVQDAFFGLYRNWARLTDPAMALPYLRRSVLNGCKSVLRWRRVRASRPLHEPAVASAESNVLADEEQQSVLTAVRRLPARQREALILRFYLLEPEAEVARVMGISPSTVRSTTHRALTALAQMLGEMK
jgi:RNA polymerase sigma-70 factor (sigma-E family)